MSTQEAVKEQMFLGLGTASPNEKNLDFSQGVSYAILIFVFAASVEKATDIAKQHLQATQWKGIHIDKMDPVDIEAIRKAQPEVFKAYEIALRDGSHAMVLEQPKQQ